jgi:hypothetical protein
MLESERTSYSWLCTLCYPSLVSCLRIILSRRDNVMIQIHCPRIIIFYLSPLISHDFLNIFGLHYLYTNASEIS